MIITDLVKEDLAEAANLALENYKEERTHVHELPDISELPDLSCFAENGLGVAARDGNRLIGFLGCLEPWKHAFGTQAKGTFSPIHAHGAVSENRALIYKKMYQKAAEKWVGAGIGYHSIALYAHDKQSIEAMFSYGFGHRCSEAVRTMNPVSAIQSVYTINMEDGSTPKKIEYREITGSEISKIRELRRLYSVHMGKSPCFMYTTDAEFEEWIEMAEKEDTRVFTASCEDEMIAYMEIAESGENFATETSEIRNICGAFCLPEYRGKSIYQSLLNYVIDRLKSEGYKLLGVEYESFNPTASGFWQKYFTDYTYSVVRRIDDCALIGDK